MKTCLPLCVTSLDTVREACKAYSSQFDLFEIWLDYLSPLKRSAVEELLSSTTNGAILLFRRKDLSPSHTSKKRQEEFIDSLQSKNLYWDFDITVQEEALQYFRNAERESPFICSFHNYEATPSTGELRSIAGKMDRYTPSIVKFACYCKVPDDALRLLTFQRELIEQGRQAIVLGMGEHGMITRVFAEQYGAACLFLTVRGVEGNVSEEIATTAPGQLSIEDYQEIQRVLRRVSDGGK